MGGKDSPVGHCLVCIYSNYNSGRLLLQGRGEGEEGVHLILKRHNFPSRIMAGKSNNGRKTSPPKSQPPKTRVRKVAVVATAFPNPDSIKEKKKARFKLDNGLDDEKDGEKEKKLELEGEAEDGEPQVHSAVEEELRRLMARRARDQFHKTADRPSICNIFMKRNLFIFNFSEERRLPLNDLLFAT